MKGPLTTTLHPPPYNHPPTPPPPFHLPTAHPPTFHSPAFQPPIFHPPSFHPPTLDPPTFQPPTKSLVSKPGSSYSRNACSGHCSGSGFFLDRGASKQSQDLAPERRKFESLVRNSGWGWGWCEDPQTAYPPPQQKMTYAKKILRNYFRGHCDNSA